MKATGIVRRIDDLGRVVIPKEIRRTMRIREGEPLEIFTSEDGGVVFRKYSPIGDVGDFTGEYAEAIHKASGLSVVICDMDSVVAAAGVSKKEYLSQAISGSLVSLLEKRKPFAATADGTPIHVTEKGQEVVTYLAPIVSEGSPVGGVMVLAKDTVSPDELTRKLINTGAMFLSSQMQV